ncbi:MAG TPA: ATP-grasp ribosomal peptide maturase, partial [Micromonosporaceae bacterium]
MAAELALRGVPVVRLDPADFPTQMSMAATIGTGRSWDGIITLVSGDVLDVAKIGAIYRRRPAQFVMDERMSAPERAFAYGEARRGFGGVLTALGMTSCLWVNDPAAVVRAEYKPVQLAVASACGLHVPETLITSDPDAAHAWAKELRRPIIYKSMSGVWHADEGQTRILYTTPIADPGELLDP